MSIKRSCEKLVSRFKESPPLSLWSVKDASGWLTPQINDIKSSFNQSSIYSHTYKFINKLNGIDSTQENEFPKTLELFNEIQKLVDTEVHRSKWYEITQKQINDFAALTGDNQWIHTDCLRAKKESPFRSTIAHGFFLISLLPMLRNCDNSKTYDGARLILNCCLDQLSFEYPVKPGQKIQARFELENTRIRKRYIEISERAHVVLMGSDKTVLSASVVSRLYT